MAKLDLEACTLISNKEYVQLTERHVFEFKGQTMPDKDGKYYMVWRDGEKLYKTLNVIDIDKVIVRRVLTPTEVFKVLSSQKFVSVRFVNWGDFCNGNHDDKRYYIRGYCTTFTNGWKTVAGGGGAAGYDSMWIHIFDQDNELIYSDEGVKM